MDNGISNEALPVSGDLSNDKVPIIMDDLTDDTVTVPMDNQNEALHSTYDVQPEELQITYILENGELTLQMDARNEAVLSLNDSLTDEQPLADNTVLTLTDIQLDKSRTVQTELPTDGLKALDETILNSLSCDIIQKDVTNDALPASQDLPNDSVENNISDGSDCLPDDDVMLIDITNEASLLPMDADEDNECDDVSSLMLIQAYVCTVCPRLFGQREELKEHTLSMHKYGCGICGKMNRSRAAVKKCFKLHLISTKEWQYAAMALFSPKKVPRATVHRTAPKKQIRNEQGFRYICPICLDSGTARPYSSTRGRDLKRHVVQQHGAELPELGGLPYDPLTTRVVIAGTGVDYRLNRNITTSGADSIEKSINRDYLLSLIKASKLLEALPEASPAHSTSTNLSLTKNANLVASGTANQTGSKSTKIRKPSKSKAASIIEMLVKAGVTAKMVINEPSNATEVTDELSKDIAGSKASKVLDESMITNPSFMISLNPEFDSNSTKITEEPWGPVLFSKRMKNRRAKFSTRRSGLVNARIMSTKAQKHPIPKKDEQPNFEASVLLATESDTVKPLKSARRYSCPVCIDIGQPLRIFTTKLYDLKRHAFRVHNVKLPEVDPHKSFDPLTTRVIMADTGEEYQRGSPGDAAPATRCVDTATSNSDGYWRKYLIPMSLEKNSPNTVTIDTSLINVEKDSVKEKLKRCNTSKVVKRKKGRRTVSPLKESGIRESTNRTPDISIDVRDPLVVKAVSVLEHTLRSVTAENNITTKRPSVTNKPAPLSKKMRNTSTEFPRKIPENVELESDKVVPIPKRPSGTKKPGPLSKKNQNTSTDYPHKIPKHQNIVELESDKVKSKPQSDKVLHRSLDGKFRRCLKRKVSDVGNPGDESQIVVGDISGRATRSGGSVLKRRGNETAFTRECKVSIFRNLDKKIESSVEFQRVAMNDGITSVMDNNSVYSANTRQTRRSNSGETYIEKLNGNKKTNNGGENNLGKNNDREMDKDNRNKKFEGGKNRDIEKNWMKDGDQAMDGLKKRKSGEDWEMNRDGKNDWAKYGDRVTNWLEDGDREMEDWKDKDMITKGHTRTLRKEKHITRTLRTPVRVDVVPSRNVMPRLSLRYPPSSASTEMQVTPTPNVSSNVVRNPALGNNIRRVDRGLRDTERGMRDRLSQSLSAHIGPWVSGEVYREILLKFPVEETVVVGRELMEVGQRYSEAAEYMSNEAERRVAAGEDPGQAYRDVSRELLSGFY